MAYRALQLLADEIRPLTNPQSVGIARRIRRGLAELWTPQAKATLTREPSHHPATSRRSTKLGILSPASRACELDEARQMLPLGKAHGGRASRVRTTAGVRQ